jgi:hypothetical protein
MPSASSQALSLANSNQRCGVTLASSPQAEHYVVHDFNTDRARTDGTLLHRLLAFRVY